MSGTSESTPHLRGLTSASKKDLAKEAKLSTLNALVADLEQRLEEGLVTTNTPPIFVLGPPRSGTTLMIQLLTSTGLVSTATNFVAKFWKAPALGIMIQNAAGLDPSTFMSNFGSKRGETSGLLEPSEFGYFWSSFFDLGQATHALGPRERQSFDVLGLKRALAAMEKEAGQPLAFKNNTWFTLNADFLAETFPGCTLVACDRDPFFIAQSLWLQRQALYKDVSQWWSVRPQDYQQIIELTPIEQVAAQAVSIGAGMDECLARLSGARIVRVPYVNLVEEPRISIAKIFERSHMTATDIDAAINRLPERLPSTNQVQLTSQDEAALRAALERRVG